jgi:hypothetical protein
VLEVDIGGRDEDVDPGPRRGAQRLSREIDIFVDAACQRGEHRAAHLGRDLVHAPVVACRRRRKARLDDVHVQGVELPGQLQFLFGRHRVAGRLLAVAQGGIEDDHVSHHELSPGS